MKDEFGLTRAHYEALYQVLTGAFREIDGRLMRVLTRRGFARVTKQGTWNLTATGKKALVKHG